MKAQKQRTERDERRSTPPSLEEWAMFQKCPEHHRQHCLDYEYCREPESKRIRKLITDWRKTPAAAKYLEDGVLWDTAAFYLSGELPELCFRVPELLLRFSEFPEKSFLEIPETTRTERLPVVLSIIPLEGFKWENLISESGHTQDFLEKDEGDGLVAYSVFRIDWRYSNNQLVEAFRRWLVDMRARNPARQHYDRRPEWTSKLKQLGALRLLRCMTWNEAADYTQKILGYALYSDQPAWARARRAAKTSLQEFLSFAMTEDNR